MKTQRDLRLVKSQAVDVVIYDSVMSVSKLNLHQEL